MKLLYKILIAYDEASKDNQVLKFTQVYCVYCQKNQFNWKSKHQDQAFETNIINIENNFKNQFQKLLTQWECVKCNIALCKIKNC